MLFPRPAVGERHVGTGEYRGMEFFHVNARTIVNKVRAASRMPFGHTINAYRGCSHACTYCFARPTHTYLGLGMGDDFERKIVVKVNAVERLGAELRSPRWKGDPIAMGTNTDPYQKAEGKYHLTQGIVRVLAEAGNPFSILTKSTLVLRDLELLAYAATRTHVRLALSIGSLDRDVWQTDRARDAASGQAFGSGEAAHTGRCAVRGADRPGLARAVGRRRPVASGGASVPRGRRGLGHAGRPPPASRASGSTTSAGSPEPGPSWWTCTPNVSARAPINREPSNSASPRSCERWRSPPGAAIPGAATRAPVRSGIRRRKRRLCAWVRRASSSACSERSGPALERIGPALSALGRCLLQLGDAKRGA